MQKRSYKLNILKPVIKEIKKIEFEFLLIQKVPKCVNFYKKIDDFKLQYNDFMLVVNIYDHDLGF